MEYRYYDRYQQRISADKNTAKPTATAKGKRKGLNLAQVI